MYCQQYKSPKQASMYLADQEIRLEKFALMLLADSGIDVLTQNDAAKVLRHRCQGASGMQPNELQREVSKLVAEIVSDEARNFIYVEGADCAPQQRSGRFSWQVADDLMELEAMLRRVQKERANLLGN